MGEIHSQSQIEHRQILPQPGWVEHDAMEIWENTKKVIVQALEKGNLSSGELAAIGITNQRETTVAWNRKTGVPIHNAIVWQDTRTAEFLNSEAIDQFKAEITNKTGLPLSLIHI